MFTIVLHLSAIIFLFAPLWPPSGSLLGRHQQRQSPTCLATSTARRTKEELTLDRWSVFQVPSVAQITHHSPNWCVDDTSTRQFLHTSIAHEHGRPGHVSWRRRRPLSPPWWSRPVACERLETGGSDLFGQNASKADPFCSYRSVGICWSTNPGGSHWFTYCLEFWTVGVDLTETIKDHIQVILHLPARGTLIQTRRCVICICKQYM